MDLVLWHTFNLKACTNKLEYPSEDMHCLNKQTNSNSDNHPQMTLELKTNYFNLGGNNIKDEICFIFIFLFTNVMPINLIK